MVFSLNGQKDICYFLGKEQRASEWTTTFPPWKGLWRATRSSVKGINSLGRLEMSEPTVSLGKCDILVLELPFILCWIPDHGCHLVPHNLQRNDGSWRTQNGAAFYRRNVPVLILLVSFKNYLWCTKAGSVQQKKSWRLGALHYKIAPALKDGVGRTFLPLFSPPAQLPSHLFAFAAFWIF